MNSRSLHLQESGHNGLPRQGADWFQRGLAALIVVLLAIGLRIYPAGGVWLAGGVVAFGGVLMRYPHAWVLALPILLPWVNLAPWSGQVFLEEFDFFVMTVVAVQLWYGFYAKDRRLTLTKWQHLLLWLMIVAYGVSFFRGLLPLGEIDLNAFANYFSSYNALRLGRGVGWALVLLLPLLAAFRWNPELTRQYLMLGMVVGLVGVGGVALWERNVLSDFIYGQNRYEILSGLLDFSTPYRITALFAEMHTGGEAIDGYLALAWPFSVVLAFSASSRFVASLALFAIPLALYSALVTFSRGTYLALVAGGLVLALGAMALIRKRISNWKFISILLGVVVVAVLAGLVFRFGGVLSLGFTLIFFVAVLFGMLRWTGRRWGLCWLIVGAGCLTTYWVARGQLTSKWMDNSPLGAYALSLVAVLVSALVAGGIGHFSRGKFRWKELLIVTVLLSGGIGIGSMSLFGARMEARFSGVQSDLLTRATHWRLAVSLMRPTLDVTVFGMGLGAFPRTFLYGTDHNNDGMFAFGREGDNTFLTVSGSQDLRFTQRVNMEAYANYTVSFDYRTQDPRARIRVRLCRRHLIEPLEWNPLCLGQESNVVSTHGQWARVEWPVNIGELGDGERWGRPPLIIEVANRRAYDLMSVPPAFVDFDNFEIRDEAGRNLLANGDFSEGMNRWFPLYDFNHLPWHVKNIFVYLYFELGLFGVFVFLVLVCYVVAIGIQDWKQGDWMSLAVLSSLFGFISVGLFGTLLDVPRLTLIFFLLMFALLANHQALKLRYAGKGVTESG